MSPFRFFVAVLALAAVAALAQDNTAGVHAQIGTISGVVWNDLNTNGIRDTGEPGVPGWQVAVVKGHLECGEIICVYVPSEITETAEDGSYTLTVAELRIPTPSVCLTIPPGWTATAGSGTEHRLSCVADSSAPRNSVVSVRVPQADGSVATVDFGVVERNVTLSAVVQCPNMVTLNSEFECTVTVGNDGEVVLTGFRTGASRGICFISGGCVAGGNIQRARALELVRSDPPWTELSVQYGDPTWEPLGSGSLAPGEGVVLRITLRGTAINNPGEREHFGIGAFAFATFGSYVVPFETYSPDGAEITVVEFLPDPTPTAIPSATPASAATPSSTPTSATPAPALPAAGHGPSEDNGWMVEVVLLAMVIVTLGAGVSLIGLGYRKL